MIHFPRGSFECADIDMNDSQADEEERIRLGIGVEYMIYFQYFERSENSRTW